MKRLVPILLLLISGVVHAEAPITGAFGQMLGGVADENLKLQSKKDSSFLYYFEPKNGNSVFKKYLVRVTPVKRLIYQIYASGEVEGGCNRQLRAFKKVLDEKYGDSVGGVSEDDLGFRVDWYRKKNGKTFRKIALHCAKHYSRDLSLYYIDFSIKEGIVDELAAALDVDNL